ncbi:unnamed protein product [Moneuplotes crassus]|uniref:Uncharacterized protein n=1 Tax=Euplotes crassus TaxID=5936 RepID=A0AAD1X656_EUPCR|nr:unnamed protein product [Moneuplotes crassus]
MRRSPRSKISATKSRSDYRGNHRAYSEPQVSPRQEENEPDTIYSKFSHYIKRFSPLKAKMDKFFNAYNRRTSWERYFDFSCPEKIRTDVNPPANSQITLKDPQFSQKWGKLMDLVLHKDNEGFTKSMNSLRNNIFIKREFDSLAQSVLPVKSNRKKFRSTKRSNSIAKARGIGSGFRVSRNSSSRKSIISAMNVNVPKKRNAMKPGDTNFEIITLNEALKPSHGARDRLTSRFLESQAQESTYSKFRQDNLIAKSRYFRPDIRQMPRSYRRRSSPSKTTLHVEKQHFVERQKNSSKRVDMKLLKLLLSKKHPIFKANSRTRSKRSY